MAAVNVPIKRGTARRLGIVRPLPPGVYWAPLPGPCGVAAVTASAARGTARRLGLRLPPFRAFFRGNAFRGPTEELRVQTWSGGEWVKTGDRIDYRPGAAP